jgi:hypothetical protein
VAAFRRDMGGFIRSRIKGLVFLYPEVKRASIF